MGSYTPSDVDLNGLLVASVRQDQSGAYPPIYNMPHGTIQLAQGFSGMQPGSPWPFPLGSIPNEPDAQRAPGAENVDGMRPSLYGPFGGASATQTADALSDTRGTTSGAPLRSGPSAGADEASGGAGPTDAFSDGAGKGGGGRGGAGKKRAMAKGEKDSRTGRRKIKIEFIDDDSRRHITFSKRKAGIMKKAYELATLTGTQVLLLVVSQTGLVYTFTTPKLEAVVKQPAGRNLIQECLNAPDPVESDAGAYPGSGASASSSAVPLEMYAKEEAEDGLPEDEEGDDDDDEEEGGDVGRADAGLTAHALGMDAMSPAAAFSQPGHPLFYPGWAQSPAQPVASGKRPEAELGAGNLKRRRTQPDLSSVAMSSFSAPTSGDLPAGFYAPGAVPPLGGMDRQDPQLMPNMLPMYYNTNHTSVNAADANSPRPAAPAAVPAQESAPQPQGAPSGGVASAAASAATGVAQTPASAHGAHTRSSTHAREREDTRGDAGQ
ncbi:transcription factor of the MADS box [Malassezia sp. CBS 17886]|nr:transcription factor of the MADS box [Malassezia sp. CBS 17886]